MAADSIDLHLEPADNQRIANLCGQFDEHLRQIEQRIGIEINNRGGHFTLTGPANLLQTSSNLLEALYDETKNEVLTAEKIHLFCQESNVDALAEGKAKSSSGVSIRTKRSVIKVRGENQSTYVEGIRNNDLTLGVGPAGTGKTYLAVACAVEALEKNAVSRLVLVRPAVEAGERLGFLPGDLSQKVDPYLRPMYDALYEMLGFEKVEKLIERHVIEVAPLAYMRGRTLNDAFIILDEAQNTTREQMKMFLTRIGFGSTAVVTGDVTQIDIPQAEKSGLKQAVDILDGVKGVSMTFFEAKDVVRHPLVKRIVKAYDKLES